MLHAVHVPHLPSSNGSQMYVYIQTIGYLEREGGRETGINVNLTFFLRRSSNPKGKFLSTGRLMAVELSHMTCHMTHKEVKKSHVKGHMI